MIKDLVKILIFDKKKTLFVKKFNRQFISILNSLNQVADL